MLQKEKKKEGKGEKQRRCSGENSGLDIWWPSGTWKTVMWYDNIAKAATLSRTMTGKTSSSRRHLMKARRRKSERVLHITLTLRLAVPEQDLHFRWNYTGCGWKPGEMTDCITWERIVPKLITPRSPCSRVKVGWCRNKWLVCSRFLTRGCCSHDAHVGEKTLCTRGASPNHVYIQMPLSEDARSQQSFQETSHTLHLALCAICIVCRKINSHNLMKSASAALKQARAH